MPAGGTDINNDTGKDFLDNAYNKLLPEYINTLTYTAGSYDELFNTIAQLFDDVLGYKSKSAGFAVFWTQDLNLGEKLSVPHYTSPVSTEEEFQTILNATAELLVVEAIETSKILKSDIIPGFALAVPIRSGSAAFGYAVVFYGEEDTTDDKTNAENRICDKITGDVEIGKDIDENNAEDSTEKCKQTNKNDNIAESKQAAFLVNAMYITALCIEKDSGTQKFEHFIMNDYLTELPNRTYLYEALVFALQTAEISGTRFALLIIRVDGLKHINNSLGIIVGDLMLKEMGLIIRDAADTGDPSVQVLAGRLSGGDFAVLLTYPAASQDEDSDRDIVKSTCEAILKRTNEPVVINNYELYPSLSIGAGIYPYHGETPEALMRRADLAKNSARQAGHNTYKIYDDLMEGASDKLLFLSNNLPVAIASNQFELFYQAQADTVSERVIGAEALIRWNHPEKGLIYPGDFIGYAEDNGYGIQIDMLVLEMIFRQLELWQEKGMEMMASVNISPKHFVNGLIYDTVSKMLAGSTVDPSMLKIELLESVLLEDFDVAVKVIKSLQSLGVSVALDDFGAGYSSLEYVAMLPLDYLKIDRTFTMNLDKRPSNAIILKTIMTLAEGMGVKTIAEGVETKEQLEFLRDINCDIVQGYYINKPMPLREFEELVEENRKHKL